MVKLNIGADDLASNPTRRVPVALCIDTSYSMLGEKMTELIECINLFYDAVDDDDDAHDSAEIAIVQFDDAASVIQDFASIERLQRLAGIPASGNTRLGEGVNLALDILEQRKKAYVAAGRGSFQPWLVLMTDGQPNGSKSELDRARQRVADLASAGRLTVIPVGIGGDANMNVLESFSSSVPPLRLDTAHFGEFFKWLSASISAVSRSLGPGAEPEPELSPELKKRVHGFEGLRRR
ncbi:vWA domain-containing protein [Agromyces sp. M3QZ16-3]|uniref:vWA domain-containing protein n=1 Tax=Agromyces sp. M3QZ16-3 TaxID=3447585 RepID=UPI003F68C3EB